MILWEDGSSERTTLAKARKELLPEGAEKSTVALVVHGSRQLPDDMKLEVMPVTAVKNLMASTYVAVCTEDAIEVASKLKSFGKSLTVPNWGNRQRGRAALMVEAVGALSEALSAVRAGMWRWYDLYGDVNLSAQIATFLRVEVSAPSLEVKQLTLTPVSLVEPGFVRRALKESGAKIIVSCPWSELLEVTIGVMMALEEVSSAFILAKASDLKRVTAGMRETLAAWIIEGKADLLPVCADDEAWVWVMMARDETMVTEIKTGMRECAIVACYARGEYL
jgi:hypothetical protein